MRTVWGWILRVLGCRKSKQPLICEKCGYAVHRGWECHHCNDFWHDQLTSELAKTIKELIRTTTLRNVEIAGLYNVSQWTVSGIRNGRHWKDA